METKCKIYFERTSILILRFGDLIHGRLVDCFPSEIVFASFVPIAFDRLTNGVAAVKFTAANSIATFLKHSKTEKTRSYIFGRLIREFARAKSCLQRISFVHISYHILQHFSTKFFKVI